MKTLTLSLVIACGLSTLIVSNSCKRDVSLHSSSNDATTSQVATWLDQQKQGKQPGQVANIGLLADNLDFSRHHVELSDNGEQFLVIPLKDSFRIRAGIEKSAVANLLLVLDRSGHIRNGNIVLFTDDLGADVAMPANTIYHIFNTAEPECNGKFQFLAVTGAPQYELKYKDKHLVSSALYQSKPNSSPTGRSGVLCYDWYLVTTWYDMSGHVVEQTRVFLYTTCGDCGNTKYMSLCSTDGGGGGDCCISDPNAQLSVRASSQAGSDQCGLETVDPLTGIHTKTCKHSWYVIDNSIMWFSWKDGSIEQAVETMSGGVWKFQSVTHQGKFRSGTVPPCMTASFDIGSSIGSFSGSTARMDLDYSLTVTYPCVPKVPGGNQNFYSHASTQWLAR